VAYLKVLSNHSHEETKIAGIPTEIEFGWDTFLTHVQSVD